jgi:hypothetical protein
VCGCVSFRGWLLVLLHYQHYLQEVFYCSAKVAGQVVILFEMAFPSDLRSCIANARSRAVPLLALVQDVIQRIVS